MDKESLINVAEYGLLLFSQVIKKHIVLVKIREI